MPRNDIWIAPAAIDRGGALRTLDQLFDLRISLHGGDRGDCTPGRPRDTKTHRLAEDEIVWTLMLENGGK